MSKTIWKYVLPVNGGRRKIAEAVIQPLRVVLQNGQPTLWAIVDPDKNVTPTEIIAVGTGWDLSDEILYNYSYYGTCEDASGYVWHYFATPQHYVYNDVRMIVDDDVRIDEDWVRGRLAEIDLMKFDSVPETEIHFLHH